MRSRTARSFRSKWRRLYDKWSYETTELFGSKICRQALASIAILAILMVIGSGESKLSHLLGDKVRYVCKTEYDFLAAIKTFPGSESIRSVFSIQTLQRFWENSGQPSRDNSSINFAWPVNGNVTSPFGWRKEDPNSQTETLHQGIDIEAPSGTPVVAAAEGVVEKVEESITYGKVLEIRHDEQTTSVYSHCSEITVEVGQRVNKGDVVAKVGSTGKSSAPHLHFEVKRDGKQVNPLELLR